MGSPINKQTPVFISPTGMGSKETRVKVKLWRSLAESSARMNLLRILMKEGIGLNEIEGFNLGLRSKYKSNKFKNSAANLTGKDGKVRDQAMKCKLADEQCYYRELLELRNKARREIDKKLVKNSRPYRKFMSKLRQEEQSRKQKMTEKYKKKVEHLRKKYKSDKNLQQEDVPEDIQEFSDSLVFDKKKYDQLERDSYEIKTVGDIKLTSQEEQILKLHPKFCIVGQLQEIEFEQEQESALAKLRMEFRKSEENKDLTQEEIKNCEELEARCRQVFDPETKEYDARRKRVTDLQECSRVTLPKPLSAENEAKLELRKATQMEIFKEYLAKNTDKKNNQKSNLTRQEQEGLKTLQKRIKEGDLIVLKTDKSSKFTVTNEQEYIKMGQEHISQDRMVTRQELIEIEENINGHSRAWAHIWGSGKDHKHFDRIMTSKVTHSENVANLYLMHKDHKPGIKTRPTATGHSSNSLGLSNSVAEVLESVANSEKNRYNTISSEDMLNRMHGYNKKIEERLRSKDPQDLDKNKLMASQGVPEPWDPAQEQEKQYSVIGSDVKALYPSIESEPTGKIIRQRVEKSPIKLEGFDMKMGLAYVAMNKNLTTELDKISELLPTRKSGKTSQLKMSAVKSDWDPNDKFSYKREQYTPLEIKQVQARVVEIATRALFENHLYKFGNKTYQQTSGGSIGDRWTGAAAELVVQDWAEQYQEILVRSGIEVLLLAGYVDDGRQGTTVLRQGMKFCDVDKKFKYNKETEQDDKTRSLAGETTNQRMARKCQIAMNSINKNLQFTVECEDDYGDKKLPTLDFKIWQDKNGKINHTYYQKEMKSPYLLMARSAAPQTQKMQILSNELTRRLLNINKQENGQEEYNRVVDQFTKEAFNSEYNQKTTRNIVISGIRAWKARQERRKTQGQETYRSASSTLKTRTRKKLLARENWYKENDEIEAHCVDKKHEVPGLPGGPRALGPKNKVDKKNGQDKNIIKAVMFVPYTTNGTLAKMLRENEEKLVELTGTRVKIVERTGTKIQDILTKSNPWQGQDCERKNCLLCITKTRTGKLTSQDCSKRNIVYETSCATCEEIQLEELENSDLEEQEKQDKKKNLKIFKYIGESSRSAYERGWEHLNDMAKLDPKSHMLKHVLTQHPGQDIMSIKFNMKVRKFCKTSFERQILESVTIQQERQEHQLLNSKSEYNRCSLPRLSTMMGENEYKKYNESKEQEKIEDEALDKKIRELRKKNNKARLHPTKEGGPKRKRRKIGTSTQDYVDIQEIWSKQATSEQETHKKTPTENYKETPEKFKIPTFPPPPPPKPEISQLLSNKEQFKQERLLIKQEKKQANELRGLCRQFLEENDKSWGKRRKERLEERDRLERLEKSRILSKRAKINHLEKTVEIGMEKIPQQEKNRLELEEREKRKRELEQTKQDLWKLRKQERKQVQSDETRKIKEMTRKLEVLKKILDNEKEKVKLREQEQTTRLKKKEKTLKLAAEKAKKWAMIRWVNDYIEENQEKWENADLIKIQEKYEQEKETRMEVIKSKKRKFEDPFDEQDDLQLVETLEKTESKRQKQQKMQITNIEQQTENKKWEEWRQQTNNELENKQINNQELQKHEQEINKTPKKVEIKLKQPKLKEIIKTKNNKQDTSTVNTNKQQQSRKPDKTPTNTKENNKPPIKLETETNKNKIQDKTTNTNNDKKQQTNKKLVSKQTTTNPEIKKPTLIHKPTDPRTNKKQTNIHQMFNNINKQHDTKQQTTPTRNQYNTKNSSQKTKKVSRTAEKKKRNEEEKNTVKKLQGFWVKFAEEQKLRRLSQNRPPELAVTDQSYCMVNHSPNPPTQASTSDVLEDSNPMRNLKSETNYDINRITSRVQLDQDKSVYNNV